MARKHIGNVHGVQKVGGKGDEGGWSDANALSVDAMRTRLTAISATAYSSDKLDRMTTNDMLYALRVHDSAGTVR